MNTYNLVNKVLLDVLKNGHSLQSSFSRHKIAENSNSSRIKAVCFGVIREYWSLKATLDAYLKRKIKPKDKDIELFLITAIYQLVNKPGSEFAVVDESVKAVKKSRKVWASGFVNGILRAFLRDSSKRISNIEAELGLPLWLVDRLKVDWPDSFKQISAESLKHPPMSIRVNGQKSSVKKYKELLESKGIQSRTLSGVPDLLILDSAVEVAELPGFEEGFCSVQDGAAQLAARILNAKSGETILDACAAPGGKTGHLLELHSDIRLVAADIDAERLKRVEQNLARLELPADIVKADLSRSESFTQNCFNHILLDAPCSALGIIRRHPDIKHLRKNSDIDSLGLLQQKILQNCWYWLKPRGRLLYATCSIVKQENEQQIGQFLNQHENAELVPIDCPFSSHSEIGLQLLPGDSGLDGFYYALLQKKQ